MELVGGEGVMVEVGLDVIDAFHFWVYVEEVLTWVRALRSWMG